MNDITDNRNSSQLSREIQIAKGIMEKYLQKDAAYWEKYFDQIDEGGFENLRKLNHLHEEGFLTDDEYIRTIQRILLKEIR